MPAIENSYVSKFISNLFQGLVSFFRFLPEVLAGLLRLPQQVWFLVLYLCRHGLRCLTPRPRCKNEIDIPPEIRKRADPMLYSQTWLMSMGVAVTWDNPDIQLYKANVPVSSEHLEKDTDYEVRVRVWNNAYGAPAPGLPVHLSYFGFGAGSSGVYVGKKIIDLGAKGSSQCPAIASFVWRTPNVDGHFCLQASLDWADDANPSNNMGQENTNVGTLHSPAFFEFRVKNNASVRRKFVYEADDYRLPDLFICAPENDDRRMPPSRLRESQAAWERARAAQGYGKFNSWVSDWTVKIEPAKQILEADEEITVKVSIESNRPDFMGRKPFNIHVFAALESEQAPREYVGGVTLYVEK